LEISAEEKDLSLNASIFLKLQEKENGYARVENFSLNQDVRLLDSKDRVTTRQSPEPTSLIPTNISRYKVRIKRSSIFMPAHFNNKTLKNILANVRLSASCVSN
jgi:hypothetical protein